MKKSMISKLVVLVVVMVVAGGFAFGATDSTLTMEGTVGTFASIAFDQSVVSGIAINPTTGYDNASLTGFTAVANTAAGYTVSVDSSTDFAEHDGNDYVTGGETIAFDYYIGGVLNTAYATSAVSGQNGDSVSFGIKITGPGASNPFKAADYVGTVTLAITNN